MGSNSMEDCKTNLFHLTRLDTLRWKCFTKENNVPTQRKSTVQNDQILMAYSLCVNDGLICTWKRVNKTEDSKAIKEEDLDVYSKKELWVFWFDEIDYKNINVNTTELTCVDEEGVFSIVGLKYDVRLIFFNALHKKIERTLLKQGYMLFGRWFTIPRDQTFLESKKTAPNTTVVFQFNFYIQDDVNVRIIVNAQRQSVLNKIQRHHLQNKDRQSVILAPRGLRAFLVPDQPYDSKNKKEINNYHGNDYSEIDVISEEQYNMWRRFVYLNQFEERSSDPDPQKNKNSSPDIPKMILVEIGKLKLLYPSVFVAIVDDEKDKFNKMGCFYEKEVNEDQEVESIMSNEDNRKNMFLNERQVARINDNSDRDFEMVHNKTFCRHNTTGLSLFQGLVESMFSRNPVKFEDTTSNFQDNARTTNNTCYNDLLKLPICCRACEDDKKLAELGNPKRKYPEKTSDSLLKIIDGFPSSSAFPYLQNISKDEENEKPCLQLLNQLSNPSSLKSVKSGRKKGKRSKLDAIPNIPQSQASASPIGSVLSKSLDTSISKENDGSVNENRKTDLNFKLLQLPVQDKNKRQKLLKHIAFEEPFKTVDGIIFNRDEKKAYDLHLAKQSLPNEDTMKARDVAYFDTSVKMNYQKPYENTELPKQNSPSRHDDCHFLEMFCYKEESNVSEKETLVEDSSLPNYTLTQSNPGYHALCIKEEFYDSSNNEYFEDQQENYSVHSVKTHYSSDNESDDADNDSEEEFKIETSYSRPLCTPTNPESCLSVQGNNMTETSGDPATFKAPQSNKKVLTKLSDLIDWEPDIDGDAVLSPPPSNEIVEPYSMPSISDHIGVDHYLSETLNAIYPTPPDINNPSPFKPSSVLMSSIASVEDDLFYKQRAIFEKEMFLNTFTNLLSKEPIIQTKTVASTSKFDVPDNNLDIPITHIYFNFNNPEFKKFVQRVKTLHQNRISEYIMSGQTSKTIRDLPDYFKVMEKLALCDYKMLYESYMYYQTNPEPDYSSKSYFFTRLSDDHSSDCVCKYCQLLPDRPEYLPEKYGGSILYNYLPPPLIQPSILSNVDVADLKRKYGKKADNFLKTIYPRAVHTYNKIVKHQRPIFYSPVFRSWMIPKICSLAVKTFKQVNKTQCENGDLKYQLQTKRKGICNFYPINDPWCLLKQNPRNPPLMKHNRRHPLPGEFKRLLNCGLSIGTNLTMPAIDDEKKENVLKEDIKLDNRVAKIERNSRFKKSMEYIRRDLLPYDPTLSTIYNQAQIPNNVVQSAQKQQSAAQFKQRGNFANSRGKSLDKAGSQNNLLGMQNMNPQFQGRDGGLYSGNSFNSSPMSNNVYQQKHNIPQMHNNYMPNQGFNQMNQQNIKPLMPYQGSVNSAPHMMPNNPMYNNHPSQNSIGSNMMQPHDMQRNIHPSQNIYSSIPNDSQRSTLGRSFPSSPMTYSNQHLQNSPAMSNDGSMQAPMTPQQFASVPSPLVNSTHSMLGMSPKIPSINNVYSNSGPNIQNAYYTPANTKMMQNPNPNMNPSMNPGMNPGMNPNMNPGMNPSMNSSMNPNMNPSMNYNMNSMGSNSVNMGQSNTSYSNQQQHQNSHLVQNQTFKKPQLEGEMNKNPYNPSNYNTPSPMGEVNNFAWLNSRRQQGNGELDNCSFNGNKSIQKKYIEKVPKSNIDWSKIESFKKKVKPVVVPKITSVPVTIDLDSLTINILLQDTVLDLHYDTIFDSCPICSCNSNIRSKDLGLYIKPIKSLLDPNTVLKEWSGFYNASESLLCTCGFSGVRHRYLSYNAGLFPDDAYEATAIRNHYPKSNTLKWFDPTQLADLHFMDLIKQQSLIRNLGSLIDQTSPSSDPCGLPKTNCISNYDLERCSSYIISQVDIEELDTRVVDVIQNSFIDLDNFENCVPTKKRSMADYPCFVHPWGLQKVNNMPDVSDGDYIDLLNTIGRHFEEVLKVDKKTPGSKGSQTVSEKSLSWKELCHRSSKNRGQETDGSVSEIIPSILVGSEKDLVISSPQIISSWEKLFLSPYDQSKDVLYFAMVPDDNIMVDKAKLFFDEVSRTYEGWRLGKHAKITKDFVKDGIIRVPSNVNIKPNCNSRAFQAFFDKLDRENEDEVLVKKLKAYASFCELQLATFFKNNDSLFERKAYCEILYRENSQSIKNDDTNQMDLMATTNSNVSNTDNFSRSSFNNSVNDTSVGETATVADHLIPEDEFPVLPHIIVIYLVNPFNFDVNNRTSKATRLANISLMRAFNLFISQLAEARRCSIQLELISLSSIMDLTGLFFDVYREGRLMFDEAMLSRNKSDNGMAFELIKSIVISVYTHTRIIQPSVVSNYIPKSMTRFGPSSDIQDILKDISAQKPMYLKVSCSLATLAPTTAFGINIENTFLNPAPEEKILHVSYCLIQDKWLVGAVTDDQGLLLDNTVINLETPKERNKMPKYFAGSQILDALTRFWQYIMGVLAMEVKNWRLIIGRVGKVGHGEFKTWMLLLSKNNIKRYNTRLKEACNTCNSSTTFHETPAIASACFISLEAEPYLRVFLTPSTTPMNPETKEPIANKYSSKTHMPLDISSTHITVFPTSAEIIVDNHQDNDDHGIEDLSDLVFEDDIGTLVETLGLDATTEENNLTSGYIKQSENIFFNLNISDISISSQPLAAGFIISAAPANDLPNWFWAQCPTRKSKSPVHLRSSLHINTNNIFQSDDDYGNTAVLENQHPLDSSKTDDVLRYVLESYNQLSWLNVDIITGEKKSCLPLHIQALLRLYNTIEKLIL